MDCCNGLFYFKPDNSFSKRPLIVTYPRGIFFAACVEVNIPWIFWPHSKNSYNNQLWNNWKMFRNILEHETTFPVNGRWAEKKYKIVCLFNGQYTKYELLLEKHNISKEVRLHRKIPRRDLKWWKANGHLAPFMTSQKGPKLLEIFRYGL